MAKLSFDITNLTDLLRRIGGKDRKASDAAMEVAYHPLREVARKVLLRERRTSKSPTDLVHDTYRRMRDKPVEIRNRHHFFAITALAMRQVMTDEARRELRKKRGAGIKPLPIDDFEPASAKTLAPEIVLTITGAVEELRRLDPMAADVVELRYFLEHTIDETAKILNIERERVRELWDFAKTWLQDRLASARPSR